MNSALSGIPIERRRRAAATLGLFAALCITIGVVALTGTTPGAVRVFAAIALCLAAILGLVAWGVARSVSIDLAEVRLDEAIEATVADRLAAGQKDLAGVGCACGHDHDPNEMHVTDAVGNNPRHGVTADSCEHDGSGLDCSHNCVNCVLQAMRPSPTATRGQRMRAASDR